jgi:hypothetical protein
MQTYRILLNDLTHAIEFEFHVQQLTSEHQLSYRYTYRLRSFLYRILHMKESIEHLNCYRTILETFQHMSYVDIDQVKNFIDTLPNECDSELPLTLTDQLLTRLQWDGKNMHTCLRYQLLQVRLLSISYTFHRSLRYFSSNVPVFSVVIDSMRYTTMFIVH